MHYVRAVALGRVRQAEFVTVMEPSDFRKWRKSLDLSQKDAAHILGLKRRMIQYYEKGERDGEKVKIPRAVRLACYAISNGVADYHGPHRKVQMIETESVE